MMKHAIMMAAVVALWVLAIAGAQAGQAAVLSGPVVLVTATGAEQLKFNANVPITLKKTFTLDKPDRVVIDIAQVPTARVALPSKYNGKLLKTVRFGQFDTKTSRIVLETNEPVKVIATSGGASLKIELAGEGGMTEVPEATATGVAWPDQDKEKEPANESKVSKQEQADRVDKLAKPEKAEAPEKPSKSDKGKKPTALNAKPLVIVDAGHGGQDPGAIGLHGTHEKDVTLNYARALREALLRTGRYRVALTREDDTFVKLPDRVSIARKMKADLFVSLHADSNPKPDARGLSIYTVSETASDEEAEALAERENKADIIPGIDLNTTDADVASILIDLTQRETMNKSADLAEGVVHSLHARINRLPTTHRFAGFRVLKAPDIPSVLVELGFLSNQSDERLLLTPEYRALVVNSIVKGIDRHLTGE